MALLCFVVLSTNLFHYLYESPEATFSLPTLLEYVFNVKNHGVEFSMVINDTKFFSFPGLAVVSLSTFFPSIFWGVSLALSYLAIPIRNWRRKLDDEVARERAESPSLLQYRMKYFGILAGAVGGLITVLKIQAG